MKNQIVFILSLLLVACNNAPILQEEREAIISTQNKVHETVLYKSASNYAKIFRVDAPIMGYTLSKANALANSEFAIYNTSLAEWGNSFKYSKTLTENHSIEMLINGVTLPDLKQSYSTAKSIPAGLFGSNVSFTVKRKKLLKNGLFKSVGADTTITMYIPDVVTITSPEIQKDVELMPYCFYKDFVIKWTSDPLNENGLVVMVTWSGVYVNGAQSASYVRNIDVLPIDNGSATLNDKLFDNIPEGAVANIILLRGNISIFEDAENMNSPYRFMAESHEVLPFIMVRNL